MKTMKNETKQTTHVADVNGTGPFVATRHLVLSPPIWDDAEAVIKGAGRLLQDGAFREALEKQVMAELVLSAAQIEFVARRTQAQTTAAAERAAKDRLAMIENNQLRFSIATPTALKACITFYDSVSWRPRLLMLDRDLQTYAPIERFGLWAPKNNQELLEALTVPKGGSRSLGGMKIRDDSQYKLGLDLFNSRLICLTGQSGDLAEMAKVAGLPVTLSWKDNATEYRVFERPGTDVYNTAIFKSVTLLEADRGEAVSLPPFATWLVTPSDFRKSMIESQSTIPPLPSEFAGIIADLKHVDQHRRSTFFTVWAERKQGKI